MDTALTKETEHLCLFDVLDHHKINFIGYNIMGGESYNQGYRLKNLDHRLNIEDKYSRHCQLYKSAVGTNILPDCVKGFCVDHADIEQTWKNIEALAMEDSDKQIVKKYFDKENLEVERVKLIKSFMVRNTPEQIE